MLFAQFVNLNDSQHKTNGDVFEAFTSLGRLKMSDENWLLRKDSKRH